MTLKRDSLSTFVIFILPLAVLSLIAVYQHFNMATKQSNQNLNGKRSTLILNTMYPKHALPDYIKFHELSADIFLVQSSRNPSPSSPKSP